MVRLPDWNARLMEYLGGVYCKEFEFGVLDCAMFAAGALRAMTGTDLAEKFRGYGSEREGLALVRAAGFDDHVAVFCAALRETATPVPGDLVVFRAPIGRAMGVVQGRGAYVMTRRGVGTFPLRRAVRALAV